MKSPVISCCFSIKGFFVLFFVIVFYTSAFIMTETSPRGQSLSESDLFKKLV